jgi:hypothetical protein
VTIATGATTRFLFFSEKIFGRFMGARCCLCMAIGDTRVFILGHFSLFFLLLLWVECEGVYLGLRPRDTSHAVVNARITNQEKTRGKSISTLLPGIRVRLVHAGRPYMQPFLVGFAIRQKEKSFPLGVCLSDNKTKIKNKNSSGTALNAAEKKKKKKPKL